MHTWYSLGRNSNVIYDFGSWTKKIELPLLKTKEYEKRIYMRVKPSSI
jgi:hypothetical protein